MDKKTEIIKIVDSYVVQSGKSKNEIWSELEKRIDSTPNKKSIPLYNRNLILTAASVVFAFCFAFYLAEFQFNKKLYTNSSTPQEIFLTDSTRVLLNPNSSLLVNYAFISQKRRLKLNGEALFNVRQGNTFILQFPGAKVEVLGTVFRVNAYSENKIEVNCLEGSVKVKTNRKEKILVPGTGLLKNENLEIKQITVSEKEVLQKLNGNYNWKNEPLQEIFETLGNWHDYTILAEQNIRQRKFTGNLNVVSLQNACETISFAMNLDFRIDKNKKVINFENRK